LKALAALNWITKYCGDAKYFLKADDDAFVNMFAALKHLRDVQTAGFRHDLLICLVWRHPSVARDGKWAVSWSEYARRRYPTYCCGLGYIVTADVVALLLSAACSRHIHYPYVGNPPSDDDATGSPANLLVHDHVIDRDNVIEKSPTSDVTLERIFWIDDVYVTGILVEELAGLVRHTDMSAAYCKSDKMAAVYRHRTEWSKYVFTQVGDDEAELYADTWNALLQRAAKRTIGLRSPSTIWPGRLADRYIPLRRMRHRTRNATVMGRRTASLQV